MGPSASELSQCAGQLAAAHGWAAAELLWQPPAPVWLLPALLLQLSRQGVFSRRAGSGSGGTDRGTSGTIQLAAPEQAVAARPLLLLPPSAVSPGRLAQLAARLHGAELLQPDSGQLLRVARYADSGPLVTIIGHCRAGVLTPLPLPPPAPVGWHDLRVYNKTFRAARFDWGRSDRLSLFRLAEDVLALLQDTMSFHIQSTLITDNHISACFDLLRAGAVDLGVAVFGWSEERHPFTRLSLTLAHHERGLFIAQPPHTSAPSIRGGLESGRLQALAVCLLLLATAGGYLTLRLGARAGDAAGQDARAGDAAGQDARAGDAAGQDARTGDAAGQDARAGDAAGQDARLLAGDAAGQDARTGDAAGQDARAGDAAGQDARAGAAAGQDARLSALLLQTLGAVCAQGVPLRLSGCAQYVSAAVTLAVGMLTLQFYTAGLLAQVTTEEARLPFQQLEAVTRLPGWSWAVQQRSVGADILRQAPPPDGLAEFGAQLPAATATHGNMSSWVARAAAERFAFFSVTSLVLDQCDVTSLACPRVCLHPQRLVRGWGGLPYRRSLHAQQALDAALLRFMETGLLARLRARRLPERLLRTVRTCELAPRARTRWSPLALDECWPVFTVLLGGAAAAALLLALELVTARLST